MKHIYPSLTGFVTSLETFQGEHVQGLRLQSGGFETRAGGRPRKSAAVSGTSPGAGEAGAPRPGPGAAARPGAAWTALGPPAGLSEARRRGPGDETEHMRSRTAWNTLSETKVRSRGARPAVTLTPRHVASVAGL